MDSWNTMLLKRELFNLFDNTRIIFNTFYNGKDVYNATDIKAIKNIIKLIEKNIEETKNAIKECD